MKHLVLAPLYALGFAGALAYDAIRAISRR